MDNQEKILGLYKKYANIQSERANLVQELKAFKDLCLLEDVPFSVISRVFAAEKSKKSSSAVVRNEIGNELSAVKLLDRALKEEKTNGTADE
jgi:hypothetical protein